MEAQRGMEITRTLAYVLLLNVTSEMELKNQSHVSKEHGTGTDPMST